MGRNGELIYRIRLLAVFALAVLGITAGAQSIPYRDVYDFSLSGDDPVAGVSFDASSNTCSAGGKYGWGILREITPAGAFLDLHDFGVDPSDGMQPIPPLVFDASGNLFGSTGQGGNDVQYGPDECGPGTVFKVTPAGQYSVTTFLRGSPHFGFV